MAMYPVSHMGYKWDICTTLLKLPGRKLVGISDTPNCFTHKERLDILKTQWDTDLVEFLFVKSAGETITESHSEDTHLNLLVGKDREKFGYNLKLALETNRIKEMYGRKFESISVYTPETTRDHGLSGTRMRQAAHDLDAETFTEHLGPAYTPELLERIHTNIVNKNLKLRR